MNVPFMTTHHFVPFVAFVVGLLPWSRKNAP